MWIAIVCRTEMSEINWHMAVSEGEAIVWVIENYLPKDAPDFESDGEALSCIEAAGDVVLVQEVGLVTEDQFASRRPNGVIGRRYGTFADARADKSGIDVELAKAGAVERSVVVQRQVLQSEWRVAR